MIISIMAQGTMGAGTAARLTENGVLIRTILGGRSAASAKRAGEAGMVDAPLADFVDADFILSIVPPGEALTFARTVAGALRDTAKAPVFVDLNAINPETARKVEAEVTAAGARFVDGGIIGGPPRPGYDPVYYVSGPEAGTATGLIPLGLDVRVLDGPVGAASALKMSYAGITKGTTALAATMILAASRNGAADALLAELKRSQPDRLAAFERGVPDMLGKAYRWVAEMEEISGFIGKDLPEHGIYEAIARLYERLAADRVGDGEEADMLKAFFAARD